MAAQRKTKSKAKSKASSLGALRGQRIGFIGAGKMGHAILKGLLERGVPSKHLIAADASAEACRAVERRFRVRCTDDLRAVAKASRILVLAIKPQQMAGALASLNGAVTRRHLIVSIAAGISLDWLQSRLRGIAVVRAMPNLPATVGEGYAAVAPGRLASAADRRAALALFAAVGEAIELPERQFDAFTAVCGSGPAYVFFLMHVWKQAALALGLPESVARRGIAQTMRGSLRLFEEQAADPQQLIAAVASKGGTTEAALRVLDSEQISERFQKALRAAAERSKELTCPSQ